MIYFSLAAAVIVITILFWTKNRDQTTQDDISFPVFEFDVVWKKSNIYSF